MLHLNQKDTQFDDYFLYSYQLYEDVMKTSYKEKCDAIQELAINQEVDIALMHDYKDALIGHTISNDINVAIYDYDNCIKILMKRDGMSYEDAEDFFSYNTMRAIPYMGEAKPIIIQLF